MSRRYRIAIYIITKLFSTLLYFKIKLNREEINNKHIQQSSIFKFKIMIFNDCKSKNWKRCNVNVQYAIMETFKQYLISSASDLLGIYHWKF